MANSNKFQEQLDFLYNARVGVRLHLKKLHQKKFPSQTKISQSIVAGAHINLAIRDMEKRYQKRYGKKFIPSNPLTRAWSESE